MHKIALHTFRCDDTRGCVMQFWPPDDEHICSKHVEAWNKNLLWNKFCASSWLNTEDKYTEMHGQQNVKKWYICQGDIYTIVYKIKIVLLTDV